MSNNSLTTNSTISIGLLIIIGSIIFSIANLYSQVQADADKINDYKKVLERVDENTQQIRTDVEVLKSKVEIGEKSYGK